MTITIPSLYIGKPVNLHHFTDIRFAMAFAVNNVVPSSTSIAVGTITHDAFRWHPWFAVIVKRFGTGF